MAHAAGLTTIALTDHDTMQGLAEAIQAGKKLGIHIIPGIEATTTLENIETHILGLGVDPENQTLRETLSSMREAGERSTGRLLERLTEGGFLEKTKKGSARVKAGASPLPAADAIALIHGAGGVAVWSHPAVSLRGRRGAIRQFLGVLIASGLDGIEVFHPDYSEADTRFLDALARAAGILRTAGSDFHNDKDAERNVTGVGGLGSYQTFGLTTDDILPALTAAIARRRGSAG